MATAAYYFLISHIIAGLVALISGAVAIFSAKGKFTHRKSGRIYFWSMTFVFITALILTGFQFNRFLFMIGFLSYYTVYAGVRVLQLKRLHKNQDPKWFDWLAGLINAGMNIVFIGLGMQILLEHPDQVSESLMFIGFGVLGCSISYANLKPFLVKPQKGYHWYLTHTGNMAGGYIATFTAFLSTIVSRFNIPYPFFVFILPALIGIPLLLWWQYQKERSFQKNKPT
jgi:uncharacterized membrane protein